MSETISTEIEVEDNASHPVDKIYESYKKLTKGLKTFIKTEKDRQKTLNSSKKTVKDNIKQHDELHKIHEQVVKVFGSQSRSAKALRKKMGALEKSTEKVHFKPTLFQTRNRLNVA